MFLGTTANHHYWDKKQKILFLGEWCRAYNQKSVWSNVNHEILPSPWNNAEQFEEHFSYLQTIQGKYLKILASRLNKIHGENHSLRYWRIILGPWLIYFTGIVYDRFLSIRHVAESNLVTNTWIPPVKQGNWVPAGIESFMRWSTEDNFNLYLYGRIITQLGNIPYVFKELASFSDPCPQETPRKFYNKLKNFLKSILAIISRIMPVYSNKIIVCCIKMKLWDLIKLQFNLGQFPYLRAPKVVPGAFSFNEAMRKNLKISQGANEYENLLEDLIVELMPSAYLEGFKDLRNRAINAFPKKPKIILSGALWADDAFKIWVAHQTAKEAKLILSQIGGGFETWKFNQYEAHQREICDKYFTWNLSENKSNKLVSIESSILGKYTKYVKPDPKGTIIVIANTTARYTNQTDHVFNNYLPAINILEQNRFFKKVSPEVFKVLFYRLYPVKLEWDDEKKRLADTFPKLNTYQGLQFLDKQLKKSRLAVTFSNSTSFLETISINFPTILYFDPIRAPLCLSAKPYYNELRRVKIVHDSPESVANWINEIYENPLSWWMSSDTQEVRARFCHQFARTSASFYKEWAEELLKINNT